MCMEYFLAGVCQEWVGIWRVFATNGQSQTDYEWTDCIFIDLSEKFMDNLIEAGIMFPE